VPVTDVWADGPGGRVHALLRVPPEASAPHPAVVVVHGGPTWHDSDSFSPVASAWVDHGYAVVEVNYRGSTGYGSAWRDALEGRVGLTELEDVAAVHSALVARGVVDPERSILAGASWGGYLTLLGLGTQPGRWALGIAGVPVADYVAAYEDEMESLRAFDRSLFGGSPDEVPEAYRASSPITYVRDVRAPLLVLAGANDPRCPLRQIERYVDALVALGGTVEVYRYDAGHGSLVDDERVRQMRTELTFGATHLPPRRTHS
jgi:dipeptidyl aminopeptidase/acylaminoacyl peptidase